MDTLPKETLAKMKANQEKSKQENRFKEIKEALINIGFEEDGRYFRMKGYSIKVYDSDTLENIFKGLIKFATTQKVWEIKRVLEVD